MFLLEKKLPLSGISHREENKHENIAEIFKRRQNILKHRELKAELVKYMFNFWIAADVEQTILILANKPRPRFYCTALRIFYGLRKHLSMAASTNAQTIKTFTIFFLRNRLLIRPKPFLRSSIGWFSRYDFTLKEKKKEKKINNNNKTKQNKSDYFWINFMNVS